MSDPKYTPMMAIHHALHGKPVEFENTIKGLLADRIQVASEKKREEVAKSVFGNPDTEVESEDNDAIETEDNEETGELESEVNEPETDQIETPSEEVPTEASSEEKEETPSEA